MIGYELWETTGNLIASSEDETAALRAVALSVQQHGPAVLDTVALVRVDEDDEDGGVEEVEAGNEHDRSGAVTGIVIAGGAIGMPCGAASVSTR